MSKLIFPKGVRLARANEIPGPDREEDLEKIRNACIEPGYVVHEANNSQFRFYFEANVNAPDIWPVFRKLSESVLGGAAVLMICDSDDDPDGGDVYHQTTDLLNLLETHGYNIVNHGFIQFGLGSATENSTSEVFVTGSKYFKVHAENDPLIRKIFHDFGVKEKPSLQFLDEFPRTTLTLKEKGEIVNHDEIIATIQKSASMLSKA